MLAEVEKLLADGSWVEMLVPLLAKLVVAIAIYLVGSWIVGKMVKLLQKALSLKSIDDALSHFLTSIISAVLKFLIVLVALEYIGVDTTSLLALFGAAGLAVGLAMKDSLSNFASGVMLILLKPFKVGDFIEAAGVAGVVDKISIFSTIMVTGDNKEIIIPNSHIYGGTIINYSARDTRRVDLVIGIGYNDDIKLARDLMLKVISEDERILKDKEPVVAVSELADSSVNFVVRVWVQAADYWAVNWHLLETIKTTFDSNGVSIPFPQHDVHLHKVD